MTITVGRTVSAALKLGAVCAILSAWGAQSALADIVTLHGAQFDVQYDSTKLGEFNTPVLVGDVLFFTPNAFTDSSTNGAGLVVNSQSASGIELIAHSGYAFGNFYANAQGDYTMQGAGSSVGVTGSLTATDAARPLTKTVANLALDPTEPLTIIDGAAHNWQGSAAITDATPTATPGYNPWLGNASTIDVAFWNELTATTVSGSGPQQAYIQEKFAGLQLYVDPVAVPLPATLSLLVGGLGFLGVFAHGRRVLNQ